MDVYHSDRFLYELPSGHRFPIEKYALIRDQLFHEGLVEASELVQPSLCPERFILRTHAPSYWYRLKHFRLSEKEARRLGIPLHETSLFRAMSSAHATVLASRSALKNGTAFNLGGGTHHAFYAHGEAYSMINDLAIAARSLLEEPKIERILIIDLDVHQGNGTASLMEAEDRVFTFSMHGERNYPFRKAVSDRDVAFEEGTEDETYLGRLERELKGLFEGIFPDLVLYQAGIDVLAGDRLGTLALSKKGCRERDRLVFSNCFQRGIPVAVTMGGGYNERSADIVDAHTNTFREGIRLFKE